MGTVNYRPLIDDMVWSYSRIKSFDDCPYEFFLRYISKCDESDRFYASYGSFIHKLIERFYKGELAQCDMAKEFLYKFHEEVSGARPHGSIVEKYIKAGVEYFRNFQPFEFNLVDVEKRIDFEVDGLKFVGYIDYLGEKNGEYYIIDNKSRDIKPRSRRSKPTLKDQELDNMLKQLYLYSFAINQEYGKFPKALCFNCFKAGTFIEEPFEEEAYHNAIEWAKSTINVIKNTEDFYPCCDFFRCTYLCGVSNDCIFNEMEREERRRKHH